MAAKQMTLFTIFASIVSGSVFDLAFKRFAQFHSRWALLLAESVLKWEFDSHIDSEINHFSEHVLVMQGWTSDTSKIRKYIELLEELNPSLKIRLRRQFRRDLGIRAQLLAHRIGFVISFVSTGKAAFAKIPGLSHERGLKFATPENTSAALVVLKKTDSKAETYLSGYIDALWVTNFRTTSRRKAMGMERFAVFRVHKILELLKFLDSPRTRNLVASQLSSDVFTTEISDRFRLALSDEAQPKSFNGSLKKKAISQDFKWGPELTTVPTMSNAFHGLVTARRESTQVLAPLPEARKFNEVRLQAGSTIYDSKALHVIENAADPRQLFVSGQWDHVYGWPWQNSALVRPFDEADFSIDKGALLSGRNDANWYHWIIEYLPRLMSYEKLPPEIPLVVARGMHPNFLRPLELLTKRPIVTVDRLKATKFNELWASPPVLQVVDTSHTEFSEGVVAETNSLRWLRTQLGEKIKSSGPERIFLTRTSGHRGLLNQVEVQSAFERIGFTSVDVSSLSFDEQVCVFSAADVVVGAGGAVMANYIFAKPNAKIIALASQASAGFYLPSIIADVAGAEFSYFFGKTSKGVRKFDSRLAWMHSDFYVDPKLASRAVMAAIS